MAEQPEPQPLPPHPQLGAILVCDHVIRDRDTNKSSLIGIFDRITSRAFPTVHPNLSIYVSVQDAEGDYRLRLELVRVRDEMMVGRGEAQVTAPNRFFAAEWIFNLKGLQFGEAGAYEFRLWANDRYIASRTFSVVSSSGGQANV